jgi:hypothetical protein
VVLQRACTGIASADIALCARRGKQQARSRDPNHNKKKVPNTLPERTNYDSRASIQHGQNSTLASADVRTQPRLRAVTPGCRAAPLPAHAVLSSAR